MGLNWLQHLETGRHNVETESAKRYELGQNESQFRRNLTYQYYNTNRQWDNKDKLANWAIYKEGANSNNPFIYSHAYDLSSGKTTTVNPGTVERVVQGVRAGTENYFGAQRKAADYMSHQLGAASGILSGLAGLASPVTALTKLFMPTQKSEVVNLDDASISGLASSAPNTGNELAPIVTAVGPDGRLYGFFGYDQTGQPVYGVQE